LGYQFNRLHCPALKVWERLFVMWRLLRAFLPPPFPVFLRRGPGGLAEAASVRVLAAAKRLGYRTNFAARSLKTRSAMTVAVLAPELSNDFFMDVAEGIERELAARGYTMLLASSSKFGGRRKKAEFPC